MEPLSPDSLIVITSPSESPNTNLQLSVASSSKKKPPPPKPKLLLTSISASVKYEFIKNKLLSGSNINSSCFPLIVHCLKKAKLYSLGMPDNNVIYQNLIGEFYANLIVERGVLGNTYFSTVIKGRHLIIDEYSLTRILKLPAKHPKLSTVEEEKDVVFDKKDLFKYLNVLCANDVPELECNEKVLISSDHFTLNGQFLAQVFRENIMPKFPPDKLFNFFEIKCLHDIVTEGFASNVAHLVMSQILKAHNLGYMPYGLFLTDLFDFFGICLTGQSHVVISHYISSETVSIGKALTQHSIDSLPGSSNNSPSLSEVVDFMKEIHNDVETIGANGVENMSFLTGTLDSLIRRVDRMETRLGMQGTNPQRVNGFNSEAVVVHPYGSFIFPEHTHQGQMYVNQVEGIAMDNGYMYNFPDNYLFQGMFQPSLPVFNPVFSDQVMMDANPYDVPRNP